MITFQHDYDMKQFIYCSEFDNTSMVAPKTMNTLRDKRNMKQNTVDDHVTLFLKYQIILGLENG